MIKSRLFSLMLVITILLDTCSKSIILAGFELNRDYVAKELCVKKEIKGNYCKGNCHLKQELQQEEQRENKAPSSSIVKYEINYCNPVIQQTHFVLPQVADLLFYYNVMEISQFPSAVFRPPSVKFA